MKNPFTTASKLSKALQAHGIDPEAADVGAAIKEKLDASASPDLAAKASKWDTFAAQAKEAGMDADAIVANSDGLASQLDSHARNLLKEHLGSDAPQKTEQTEPKPPAPTGVATPKELAARYQGLADAGDMAGCKAMIDAHGISFLSHLNFIGA